MKCIDDKPGVDLMWRFLKRILPYLGFAIVFFGIGYLVSPLFKKAADKGIEIVAEQTEDLGDRTRIILEEELDPQCPPQTVCEPCAQVSCPDVTCPAPKPLPPKIVYKDRIVKVPVYVRPDIKEGCTVDWQTGQVIAKNKAGSSLDCHVNLKTRKVDEYHYPKGMLRRGPIQHGVLDDALRAYNRRSKTYNRTRP